MIFSTPGYFGLTKLLPAKAPKGIIGRTTSPLRGEIGEKILGVSKAFTGQGDSTARYAGFLDIFDPGVYDIYAIGIWTRIAGSLNTQEMAFGISTDPNFQPQTLANAKAGNCVVWYGSGGNWALSASKHQNHKFTMHSVFVPGQTRYYGVLYNNGCTAWDGDVIMYAVRRA